MATILPPAIVQAKPELAAVSEWRTHTRGISGIQAALGQGQSGLLFLKWAEGEARPALERELDKRARLGPFPLIPDLLGSGEEEALLWGLFEGVRGEEPSFTLAQARQACAALAPLHEKSPEGWPPMSWSRPIHPATSERLAPYTDEPEEAVACYAAFRAMAPEVLSHCDTHPENWLLTPEGSLRLVDVEKMKVAPRGWDEALLLARLALSPAGRLELLSTYVPDEARLRTFVGASLAILASVAPEASAPAWDAHRARWLPAAAALWHAVR